MPEGHGAQTLFGAVVGTPAYMAPEQARGERAGPTADVYGLGLTLLEVLTGAAPRRATGSTETLELARHGVVPHLERQLDGAPPALAAIVRRAVAQQPEERYADAKALADDVTAWLDGRRVGAHEYRPGELIRRFVQEHRVAFGVGAFALVVLGVLATLLHLQTRAERDRAVSAELEARSAQRSADQARQAADRNLGRVLVQRAEAAAALGARPEAEVLAARALQLLGEDPRAHGVLARFGVSDRPRLIASSPRPDCRVILLSPAGDRLLCLQPDQVGLWTHPRQRAPVDPAGPRLGGGVPARCRPGDGPQRDRRADPDGARYGRHPGNPHGGFR